MKTEYVWQIIIVVIGALISSIAGYIVGSQPEKILKLQYEVFKNENISKHLTGIEDIEILHNGEKIEELSNIAVLIKNSSPKNLEDIKVHFTFYNSENKPIFVSTHPPKDRPKESISLISSDQNNYTYHIDDINISKNDFYGYLFSFHFASEKPPELIVKTSGKGITIEEDLDAEPSVISRFYYTLNRAWWVLLIYILSILLYVKFVSSYAILKKLHIENLAVEKHNQLSSAEIINLTKYKPKALDILRYMLKSK